MGLERTEQELIGAFIKDELLLIEASNRLMPEHFETLPGRLCYQVLIQHLNNVAEGKSSGRIGYDGLKLKVRDMIGVPGGISTQDAGYIYTYIKSIKDKRTDSPNVTIDFLIEYSQKKKIETGIQVGIDLLNHGKTASEIASSVVDAMTGVGEIDVEIEPEDLERGFVKRYHERQRDLISGVRQAFKLGFSEIDAGLEGGLKTKEILFIAGYPGVGKSRLADTFSVNLFESGIDVLKVTTENTRQQSVERAEAMYFGLSYQDIRRASSTIPVAEIDGREKRENRHMTIRLQPDKYSIADLFRATKLLEIKHQFKPRVVILDSPDFIRLTPTKGIGRGVEKIHNLMTKMFLQIKTWIEMNNMAFIATSHVKMQDFKGRRSKRKDRLDIGDLSDSSGKSRVADVVMTLNISEETQELGQAEIFLCKLRDSSRRPFSVMVESPYGCPRFRQIDSKY